MAAECLSASFLTGMRAYWYVPFYALSFFPPAQTAGADLIAILWIDDSETVEQVWLSRGAALDRFCFG
jgi:hypothetical protein